MGHTGFEKFEISCPYEVAYTDVSIALMVIPDGICCGVIFLFMSTPDTSPTFDLARKTLASLLDGWEFGVVQSVKRPDPGKPYFHGKVRLSGETVWMQQSKMATRPTQIGPLIVDEPPLVVPRRGEVIMGKLVRDGGGGGDRRGRTKIEQWYPDSDALRELKRVCIMGTHKTEFELMSVLRRGRDDAVWALARLVLFGNTEAFAEAHAGGAPMRLGMDVTEFVHMTSDTLCDPGVWRDFKELVPDAVHPEIKVPSAYATEPCSMAQPWRGTAPLVRVTPPWETGEVQYTPQSPAYTPLTPPHLPQSPAYTPLTPPHLPQSPAYTPLTPPCPQEYDPEAPAYDARPQEYDPEAPAYDTRPREHDMEASAGGDRTPTLTLEQINAAIDMYLPRAQSPVVQ